MTIREIDARQALHKTGLERQHVHSAIEGLRRAGLIERDAVHAAAAPQVRTLAAAAAECVNNRTLVNQVIGQARSLGVTLDPHKVLDTYQLSSDLKAAGRATTEQAFALKTNLAALGALA